MHDTRTDSADARADRVDQAIGRRFAVLYEVLNTRARYSFEIDAGPWCATAAPRRVRILTDLASWVEGYRDPVLVIVALLTDERDRLFRDYAMARATWEATRGGV